MGEMSDWIEGVPLNEKAYKQLFELDWGKTNPVKLNMGVSLSKLSVEGTLTDFPGNEVIRISYSVKSPLDSKIIKVSDRLKTMFGNGNVQTIVDPNNGFPSAVMLVNVTPEQFNRGVETEIKEAGLEKRPGTRAR